MSVQQALDGCLYAMGWTGVADCNWGMVQTTSKYFIFVPSFLGALLTLTAIVVCMVFPR